MLHILLFILKIIGILILAILGLIVTLMLIVLLVPVRYGIEADKHEAVNGHVHVTWLCRIVTIRARLHMDAVTDVSSMDFGAYVKIFGKKIYDTDRTTDQTEESQVQNEDIDVKPADIKTDVSEDEIEDIRQTLESEQKEASREAVKEVKEVKMPVQEKAVEEPKTPHVKPKDQKEAPQEEQKISRKQRILDRIKELCQKLKTLEDKIKDVNDTKNTYLAFYHEETTAGSIAFAKKTILKVLKHVLPGKCSGDITFGFDDPSMTGQVLGILSIFYPIYQNSLMLSPDFENQILEGDFKCKGRLRLGFFVIIAAKTFFNKDIRTTFKHFKALKGE